MLKVNWLRVLAVCAVLPGVAEGQTAASMVVEHGVAMKTRDGVTLRADIYRPEGDGKYPVLLQRTPYDKTGGEEFARMAVPHGFVVVVQDVRGRYTSEGEWYPFKHETEDGFDTVEWAAGLPNSNGKVGMWGGSYVGATQMLAAIGHPPHLAGICPVVTASNYHENWTYQGGALEQWFDESWTAGLAQDTMNRAVREATNARVGAPVLPLKDFPLFNLQVGPGTPGYTKKMAPYFLDWLDHPMYDGYWKQWSIEENFAKIQVPGLHVAAWYDIFQDGSLRNYLGIAAHGGSAAARSGQRLLVIVGGHAGNGRTIGSVDFGPAAEEWNEHAVTLEWYDYLFLGKQNRFATGKPVRLFVMGKNVWRDEDAWPLERASVTKFYLHSGGKANSATGDGSLTTMPARTEQADKFVYDPLNPAPTVGGPLCCDSTHLEAGPRDQVEVEARPDVLVYSTPPLDEDTEVTGPVKLDLYVKSTAEDTDFTGKLVDVWQNGFAQNVAEGILRAKYREGTSAAKPMTPGMVYRMVVDMWSTSNVFLKGHRIRVEVSSSNFPRFDRNLNTGKSAAESAETVKATNTVLHDAQHPSAVLLPLVGK